MEVIHGSTIHSLSNLLLHLTGGKKSWDWRLTEMRSHIKNHETNLLYVSISMKKYSKRMHSLASRAAWSAITGSSFPSNMHPLCLGSTLEMKNFICMTFPTRFGNWAAPPAVWALTDNWRQCSWGDLLVEGLAWDRTLKIWEGTAWHFPKTAGLGY